MVMSLYVSKVRCKQTQVLFSVGLGSKHNGISLVYLPPDFHTLLTHVKNIVNNTKEFKLTLNKIQVTANLPMNQSSSSQHLAQCTLQHDAISLL